MLYNSTYLYSSLESYGGKFVVTMTIAALKAADQDRLHAHKLRCFPERALNYMTYVVTSYGKGRNL